MQRFLIPFLTPLESAPNPESLRFLTEVWKTHGTFDHLPDKPAISNVNRNIYLEDGNNRATWFWLNGVEYVDAEELHFNGKNLRSTERCNAKIQAMNSKLGVYSPADLARQIENPEQYQVINPKTF